MKKTTKRGPATKKTTTAAEPWVPTLAALLQTIAGHVEHIRTYAPGATVSDLESVQLACGVGGFPGTDCPFVMVRGTATRASDRWDGGAWGPWVQVVFDGKAVGNRHGAIAYYAEITAPVVAWVAAYWAARAAASTPAATPSSAVA